MAPVLHSTPGPTPASDIVYSPPLVKPTSAPLASLAVPLVIGFVAICVFCGVSFVLFLVYRHCKQSTAAGLRTLVLASRRRNRGPFNLVSFLKVPWGSSGTVPAAPSGGEFKDLGADVSFDLLGRVEAIAASEEASVLTSPATVPDTPSLSGDPTDADTASEGSLPLPDACFNLDNLLTTTVEEVEAFDSASEYSGDEEDVEDIINAFESPSHGLLRVGPAAKSTKRGFVGLGITSELQGVSTAPTIVLEGCPTLPGTNCPEDIPQSPKFLKVPPAQHTFDERQEAQAVLEARAESRRLSRLSVPDIAPLRIVKKSEGKSRPFITGVSQSPTMSPDSLWVKIMPASCGWF